MNGAAWAGRLGIVIAIKRIVIITLFITIRITIGKAWLAIASTGTGNHPSVQCIRLRR